MAEPGAPDIEKLQTTPPGPADFVKGVEGRPGIALPIKETVPSNIKDLLKKQAEAGTSGHPNLTDEERKKIASFYASRQ